MAFDSLDDYPQSHVEINSYIYRNICNAKRQNNTARTIAAVHYTILQTEWWNYT